MVDMDVPRYWAEGECLGCGEILPLTDRDLCTKCDRYFDRDLIRLRQWDSSGLTAGVAQGDLETLRRQVITQHGEALELLAARSLPRRPDSSGDEET